MYEERTKLNKRKHSFCHRVVDDWNTLPQYVVDSDSVVKFEANLDRAWERQELKYDYKAKIKRERVMLMTCGVGCGSIQ